MAVLPAFDLIQPGNLDDALAALDEANAAYAGGTELVPALRMGVRFPEALVDLKRVPELRGISVRSHNASVRIGAATTHREVTASHDVRRHVPLLAEVAAHVGNARVRSTGTIGGNLCFAEPRSDVTTILVALGASVVLVSARGRRQLTVDDFLVDAFETALEPAELLIDVIVPFQPAAARYWKLQTHERPTLGVAIVERDGNWEVTVGAATARPVRTVVAAGDRAGLDGFVAELDLDDGLAGSAAYVRDVLRRRLAMELGSGR